MLHSAEVYRMPSTTCWQLVPHCFAWAGDTMCHWLYDATSILVYNISILYSITLVPSSSITTIIEGDIDTMFAILSNSAWGFTNTWQGPGHAQLTRKEKTWAEVTCLAHPCPYGFHGTVKAGCQGFMAFWDLQARQLYGTRLLLCFCWKISYITLITLPYRFIIWPYISLWFPIWVPCKLNFDHLVPYAIAHFFREHSRNQLFAMLSPYNIQRVLKLQYPLQFEVFLRQEFVGQIHGWTEIR